MLEINKKQLLSFNDLNKVRILKEIAKGNMKFIDEKRNTKNKGVKNERNKYKQCKNFIWWKKM